MLVILQLPLLWGDVFIARWMASAGIPERLIIGPYALGIALTLSLFSKFVCVHKNVGTVAIFLIIAMMAIHLRSQYRFATTNFKARPILAHADRRYSEALSLISAGSRILFVGSQDATDYLFFAPRDGYANKVIPWGQFPFDPQRMQDLVRLNCVSHVLIENDQSVGFLGAPSISTTGMASWLSNNSNFHPVGLITSGLRLFEVIASSSVLDGCKSETASNLVSPFWSFPLNQSHVAG